MKSNSLFWTYTEALNADRAFLNGGADEVRIEVEVLLAHVVQKSRVYLYTHPEQRLTFEQQSKFQTFLEQRYHGIPIAYLIQNREFWSMQFQVTSATLIPRPETEQLIEIALQHYSSQQKITCIDLGTGSGVIAIALAKECQQWNIHASDHSLEALHVAQQNAQRLINKTIYFYYSDWYKSLPLQQFDLIISNPPYIANDDPHVQQGDLRFEPRHALVADENGYSDIKKIIFGANKFLTKNGWLMLEHGYQQAKKIQEFMHQNEFSCIQTFHDLQNHPRITIAKK